MNPLLETGGDHLLSVYVLCAHLVVYDAVYTNGPELFGVNLALPTGLTGRGEECPPDWEWSSIRIVPEAMLERM